MTTIKLKKIFEESISFKKLPNNYDIKFSGHSPSAEGSIIRFGDKGGDYKVYHTNGKKVKISLRNVKNSSDYLGFSNEKELIDYLQNYVEPLGGTQSSQF